MAVPPGALLGVLGGGQLGRMLGLAGRPMGFRFAFADPDPACAAAFLAESLETAPFEDPGAVERLARRADVLTIEIEKVSIEGMRRAQAFCPVRPGPGIVEMVQDRIRQKDWLTRNGFPVAPWRAARSAAEARSASEHFGGAVFLKAAHGGYDGRGQAVVENPEGARQAFESLGGTPCAVEESQDLTAELSVMVARRPSGQIAVFPPALNHHENQILAWSVLPAPLPDEILVEARKIAASLAEELRLEGLLCVELFLVGEGRLLVNELAPRPHNSFHATEMATATSQFEQAIRAVCDLPLGDTSVLRPAAIVNLLGDLWVEGNAPPFARALEIPGVRLFLYGKGEPRPGRKMGHLEATGATSDEAVERVISGLGRIQAAVGGTNVETGVPPDRGRTQEE
ncbi:MAG: N5-carboxyaminoimidazole ribonucleotide synthase [Thermoanaerobaculia bacterium]|nr:N5-carboxyaminoimidazole ribonucleotide synthase [Thermoanaerobaculia bacterium]